MADQRTTRKISERFDVEIGRRPNRMLAYRRAATWLSGLAAVVAVALLFAGNDHRVFESRPVSQPHRLFEQQCSRCHTETWQPLLRLTGGEAHSVTQQACRHCHVQESDDHFGPGAARQDAQHCASCHAEHRGDSLLDVADQRCINCHRHALHSSDGTQLAAVPSWNQHPEFFVRRGGGPDSLQRKQKHLDRPNPLPRPPAIEFTTAGLKDNSAMRFNHAFHLHAAGLPVPPSHPDYPERKMEKLDCSSCHQPTDDGAYIKPIRYEDHCARCHTLDFSDRLRDVDANADWGGSLPHESPAVIRGVLRQRLMAFAERHPERVRENGAKTNSTRLPQKDPPPPPSLWPTREQQLEWVERQLRLVEETVMQAEGPVKVVRNELDERIQTGCGQCHFIDRREPQRGEPLLGWGIVKPGIPDRWFAYASFRHDRHQMLRCDDCHYRERGEDGSVTPVLQSEEREDVLMPVIATCRTCHTTAVRGGNPGADISCVECHRYHHPRKAPAPMTVHELLRLAPVRENVPNATD